VAKKNDINSRLTELTGFVINVIQFLILPSIAILFLFRIKVESGNFASTFSYFMLIVYVFGGFILLGIKVMELWESKYVIFFRNRWRNRDGMEKQFYKVCLPEGFDKVPSNMDNFYQLLTKLNGGIRTNYEIFEGKWYYEFSFDVIIRNKSLEIYIVFPKKREDVIFKAFKDNYPEIKLVRTEDPYSQWPKKWQTGVTKVGPYSNFVGYDLGLDSTGPLPILPSSALTGSSLTDFYNSLMDFDPQTMFVLQYTYLPYSIDGVVERWEDDMKSIKGEYLAKSTTYTYTNAKGKKVTGTTGDLVSKNQKKMINDCEDKFRQDHFKTHFRFMVFYPTGKYNLVSASERLVKAFCGSIWAYNGIKKNWFTANDRFFITDNKNLFNSIRGPFMNKHYHIKEIEYRSKVLMESLRGRALDVSHPSDEFLLEIPGCSSLFHFPHIQTFPEEFGGENNKKSNTLEVNPTPTQNLPKLETKKLMFINLTADGKIAILKDTTANVFYFVNDTDKDKLIQAKNPNKDPFFQITAEYKESNQELNFYDTIRTNKQVFNITKIEQIEIELSTKKDDKTVINSNSTQNFQNQNTQNPTQNQINNQDQSLSFAKLQQERLQKERLQKLKEKAEQAGQDLQSLNSSAQNNQNPNNNFPPANNPNN
jgi:hypothetical protein